MAVEWKYKRVDLADDLTTIEASACLVNGLYVNTALSAHVCEIKDDTSSVYSLIASLAAGSRVEFGPTIFATKLIVDPDNAATGSITVEYVLLGEPHG